MVFDDLAFEANRIPPLRSGDNCSSSWCIVLVRTGEAAFRIDSTEHTVRCREGLLVPAGVQGVWKSDLCEDVACWRLRLCDERLHGMLTVRDRLLLRRAANRPQCVRVLKAGSSLLQRLEDLAGSFDPAKGGPTHGLMELIPALMTELRESLQGDSETAGDALRRLIAILDTEAAESDILGLSLSELARKCGCTRRHLNRLARQLFGCSFLSLKIQLRLDQAASLLQDGDAKIISVAFACGFNHLGSFTAKFRRRYGTTPARWRGMILGNVQFTLPRSAGTALPRSPREGVASVEAKRRTASSLEGFPPETVRRASYPTTQ